MTLNLYCQHAVHKRAALTMNTDSIDAVVPEGVAIRFAFDQRYRGLCIEPRQTVEPWLIALFPTEAVLGIKCNTKPN